MTHEMSDLEQALFTAIKNGSMKYEDVRQRVIDTCVTFMPYPEVEVKYTRGEKGEAVIDVYVTARNPVTQHFTLEINK